MNDIEKSIIKSGIESILTEEEEDVFKTSLEECLSLKLNEVLKDIKNEVNKNLLIKKDHTEINKDIEKLIYFLENYNSITNNKLEFKNNSIMTIQEEEVKIIKNLFDFLNGKNRKILAENVLNDYSSFQQNIEFFKNLKYLL